MQLGSSKKGVLYITDDALFVYKASGSSVVLLEVFDWEQEDVQLALTALIKGNFSSLAVLNDTVDQHYRKEKVPKVSLLDAGRVVNRRLAMAFPEFPIRAYKKTGTIPKENTDGRAMDSFLFCACPDTIQLLTVVNAIRESGVSFQGVSLLPMESEGLVDAIYKGLSKGKAVLLPSGKKDKNAYSGWSILVGQNASGGLRQIVVKNGGVALTRISPIVETDADLGLWCQDVKREISSTMGYLSRFGYSPEDGLRIVIIGKDGVTEIMDSTLDIDADLTVLSVSDAASLIGVKINTTESDHVANMLHVGWVSKKSKLSFPLKSAMIDSVLIPRSQASAVAAILVLALIGSMYMFSDALIRMDKNKRDFDVLDNQRKQVQIIYDKEIQRKEALGIDMRLIQNSFEVHKKIDSYTIDPLDIYKSIASATNGKIKLDSITIKKTEAGVSDGMGYSQPEDSGKKIYPPSEATLKFSFPGTVDIEAGNRAVIDFGNRLQDKFDGATVRVVKILKDVSYKGEMQTKVGVEVSSDAPDILEAEIIIVMGENK